MFDRPGYQHFQSRSIVQATGGMVATSHPLAAAAGIDILKAGGNAFDAAVAVAATLCVVEPMMTGLGGDMFALTYHAQSGEIQGLNASGRAPQLATAARYRKLGYSSIPMTGIHSISIPGVVDGWAELLQRYGTMNFKQTLAPAIHYAKHGFPVTEMVAYYWKKAYALLIQDAEASSLYLPNGKLPQTGDLFKQPLLANTLRKLSEGGRDAFYKGIIAQQIDSYMQQHGGMLRKEDFANHHSTWVEPISTNYRGYDVLEIPPNGQGLVVLEMLNILENFDIKALGHNSAAFIHLFAEAKMLAYSDRDRYIADSEFADIPVDLLLSKEYAKQLADGIKSSSSLNDYVGEAIGGDTVYLTVVDGEGNIASVTNSIFSLFGSGVAIPETGIVLHNRGGLFSLEEGHPNEIAPNKRPFHTIIPSMVLKDGEPIISFGVMGADMQPQGQVQVLVNMIDFNMNIQQATDCPRFRHYNEGIFLESSIDETVCHELQQRGYKLLTIEDGDAFAVGGYQGIAINRQTGVLQGGSDPRKDGCAIGY